MMIKDDRKIEAIILEQRSVASWAYEVLSNKVPRFMWGCAV